MNENRRVPFVSAAAAASGRRSRHRRRARRRHGLLIPPALAAGRTLTIADVGVGDPGGDWSQFEQPTGNQVNLVSIGNAPSAVLNQLIAGGGQSTFDIINIVGGMQKPLVENDLILELDTGRLPNWQGTPTSSSTSRRARRASSSSATRSKIYGVPTVLQGDSFAYLPEKTGELNSYAALFDPKFKGFVALEDNYTTAGQKTALYLKHSGQADIDDPADMTPEEVKTVIDFMIEQKKAGQFRVIWSSFEQAVNLITSKEVHVIDCWEPMVFVASDQGHDAVYAAPKEGYLLWAMARVRGQQSRAQRGGARGHLRPSRLHARALVRRQDHAPARLHDQSRGARLRQGASRRVQRRGGGAVAEITAGVQRKFEQGGTWQNRWPTHVDVYEEEWQRFKSA